MGSKTFRTIVTIIVYIIVIFGLREIIVHKNYTYLICVIPGILGIFLGIYIRMVEYGPIYMNKAHKERSIKSKSKR